jgi:uncharacterized protein involved in exopolysaccharide biosynthesis
MTLRDLVGSLGRRWWVVLLGLVATAAVAGGLYTAIPVSYTASASVVLLPPKTLYGEGGNPYLYLGGLSQAVDVLTGSLNSDAVSGPIQRENPRAEFAVGPDNTSSGPIIVIAVTAETRNAALAAMRDVLDAAPVVMQELQNDLAVTPESLISVRTLSIDRKPVVDQKVRLQSVLGAAGAGLVVTVLVTALVDSRLLLRRARKDAATTP